MTIFIIICVLSNLTYIPFNTTATLVFKQIPYKDLPYKDINIELTQDESNELAKIFNNKVLYRDITGDIFWFGFDENVSIRFGSMIFCPACDGSSTIKLLNKDRYFKISKNDRKIVDQIFRKYGGYFPFVG